MTKKQFVPRTARHAWTREQIISVKQLWQTKSGEEVAAEMGVTMQQLQHIATQMRKAGVMLPKKRKIGQLQGLIKELMAEDKI